MHIITAKVDKETLEQLTEARKNTKSGLSTVVKNAISAMQGAAMQGAMLKIEKNNLVNINLRITDNSMLQWLDSVAVENGVSRNEVIRECVKRFIA